MEPATFAVANVAGWQKKERNAAAKKPGKPFFENLQLSDSVFLSYRDGKDNHLCLLLYD